MSENSQQSSETGSAMDYDEHERTYSLFLTLTKWGTIITVALLVAMAFGFFAGGGLIGGTIVLVLLLILAGFLA